MTKHTPGPWHFVGECEPLPNDGSSQFQVWDATGGMARAIAAVVSSEDPGIGVTEGIKNARLIAAAPDLLEACKLSLRNAESIIYMQPARIEDSVELKALRTWRDSLAAAIAKAEGGAA